MKLKVTLSPYSRKSKKEINPAVENELISSMYTREIIIADLAKATGENGHTWCHAIFSGKRNKKNFLSTQLLVADFDDRINYGDAVDRLTEYGLGVAFAYTTFSDHLPIGSADYQQLRTATRFRMVFILPYLIMDISQYEILIREGLQKLFPEADKVSSVQYWYGGKNLIQLNEDYLLDPQDLFTAACGHQSTFTSSSSAAKRQHKGNIERQKAFFEDLGSISAPPYNIYKSDEVFEPAPPIRNFDWRRARQECRLLNNFLGCTRKIWHNELFGLYLGMRRIEGGQKKWKKAVRNNPLINDNKIRKIADYVDVKNYKEKWLKGYVSSDDPVLEKYRMLTDLHPKKLKHATKIKNQTTIEQNNAEWGLTYIFYDILGDLGSAIAVLKFPTGIGKTEAYIHCANHGEVVISVATHKLKDQVSKRVNNRNLRGWLVKALPSHSSNFT